MKLTHLSLIGTLGLSAAVLAVAQERATRGPEPIDSGPEGTAVPLRPLYPDSSSGDPRQDDVGDGEDPMEVDESIRTRLSGLDLDAREAAFDEIAQKAASHPATRTALKSISLDVADPDLAFTARLALREADRLSSWGRAGSSFKSRALGAPEDPFDALRRELESVFGSDPFTENFFSTDPFAGDPFFSRSRPRLFGGGLGVRPFGARGGSDPFEEFRARAEQLREQLDAMGRGKGLIQPGEEANDPPQAGLGQTFTSSSSMSVETTPEGVRVEIVEDDGTGPKRQVFEAPTMEALLDAHPELKGRIR